MGDQGPSKAVPPPTYLSVSIYLSIHLSIYLSIHLFIYLSIYLYIYTYRNLVYIWCKVQSVLYLPRRRDHALLPREARQLLAQLQVLQKLVF